ncbi:hypothetical protein B0H10DRAFT_2198781 [Mycena sp. CBHHK59/15]|nr:hypothetical protein B0H10DRAFT_2198781 [Mycena sp. CBHHK59/15]
MHQSSEFTASVSTFGTRVPPPLYIQPFEPRADKCSTQLQLSATVRKRRVVSWMLSSAAEPELNISDCVAAALRVKSLSIPPAAGYLRILVTWMPELDFGVYASGVPSSLPNVYPPGPNKVTSPTKIAPSSQGHKPSPENHKGINMSKDAGLYNL